MPFNNKDKTVIKIKDLYQFKEYGSRRILGKFSKTNWECEGLALD